MIEVVMCICLTIMGIYFFKSTDLPKELKERSAQMRAESGPAVSAVPRKMNLPKVKEMTKSVELQINQAKLVEMNLLKKEAELKLHNAAIDKLTLTITTLEQEIRVNNEKNGEIQKMIDTHLVSLQLLQEKITALS
ncbi:MAG: hypothetical protein PHY93_00155 [Bacteriovorax sp.]|nr:hypothetical protein [Bacteriovorax sp.]